MLPISNTLGYICYYGRKTGRRNYKEARKWFEKGAELHVIESMYKLADMMCNGQGGPRDEARALVHYSLLYSFCRKQFEAGTEDGKFADVAFRLGKLYHEGKMVGKNDRVALDYLLEAQLAINLRKPYKQYGDAVVAANIQKLMNDCDKPDQEMQKNRFFGLALGRVPHRFINDEHNMVFTIAVADDGSARLEFRRRRKNGKKPDRVLWTVTPALKCMLTNFVVLYGFEIRWIWNKNPGEEVICDRYEYDEEKDTHLFYDQDQLQCRLTGGEYALSMDEFIYTVLRDCDPVQTTSGPQ